MTTEVPHLPGAMSDDALGVSASGHIVGQTTFPDGRDVATLWPRDGEPINLDQWSSQFSIANAVNSSQVAVGTEGTQNHRAFVWNEGVSTFLPDLGYGNSVALCINETGVIGGWSKGADGFAKPVYWAHGQVFEMPMLKGAILGSVDDVSETMIAIGSSDDAVCWQNGEVTKLRVPSPRSGASAHAVNNLGHIAGVVHPLSLPGWAAVWPDKDALPIHLIDLLPPRHRWLRLAVAWDINDRDQIVGQGNLLGQFDEDRAYLVTPVHPTMTLGEPSPGVAGATNTITVSGLEPGEDVYLAYGRFGGGTLIPGCRTIDNVLQIQDALTLGPVVADQDGRAMFSAYVAPGASGAPVLLQAFTRTGCRITQLVDFTFE